MEAFGNYDKEIIIRIDWSRYMMDGFLNLDEKVLCVVFLWENIGNG